MSTVKLAMADVDTYDSPHDYGDTYVQGGNGIVIGWTKGAPTRETAFVECFPEGAFIRGEGATVPEADEDCWAKLRAYLDCPGHQWVPNKPTAPAGTCSVCDTCRNNAFTAEQLGLFCTSCARPTFQLAIGDPECKLLCRSCDPKEAYSEAAILALFCHRPDAAAYRVRLDGVREGTVSDDPEALDWAYEHLKMKTPRP